MTIRNIKLNAEHTAILGQLCFDGPVREEAIPQPNEFVKELLWAGMANRIIVNGEAGYIAASTYGGVALSDEFKVSTLKEVKELILTKLKTLVADIEKEVSPGTSA